jgi:hypothetical protein
VLLLKNNYSILRLCLEILMYFDIYTEEKVPVLHTGVPAQKITGNSEVTVVPVGRISI